jgi:uncharacterized alkaline shock family protein YloU
MTALPVQAVDVEVSRIVFPEESEKEEEEG